MISELEALRPKPHQTKSTFIRHRITQDILARYFKVSQPLVSRWLTGQKEVPPCIEEELRRLADELEIRSQRALSKVR